MVHFSRSLLWLSILCAEFMESLDARRIFARRMFCPSDVGKWAAEFQLSIFYWPIMEKIPQIHKSKFYTTVEFLGTISIAYNASQ